MDNASIISLNFPHVLHKSLSSTNSKPVQNSAQCKQFTRAFVMQILKERSQKREALLMRDLSEKNKILAKWKLEETRAQEEKFRALFNRLSKSKRSLENEEAMKIESLIRKKLELADQRAKDFTKSKIENHPKAPVKEKLEKKNMEMQKVLELRKEKYASKLERMENTLGKNYEKKMLKIQLKKERREKQTLKSKVQIALATITQKSCDRFWKDYQRFAAALEKDRIQTKPSSKKNLYSTFTQQNFQSASGIENEDLNVALTRNLSEKEIALIKEDPNFFITNKDLKDKLSIFDDPVIEPAPNTASHLLSSTLFHRYSLSARREHYLSKLKQFLSRTTCGSFQSQKGEEVKEKIKELRKKQAENYAFMQEKQNMKKYDVLKRMREKQELATHNVQEGIKKRIQEIAKRNEKEASKLASGIFKKTKEKAKEDVIKGYLTALEESYVKRQVSENVKKGNLKRVKMAQKNAERLLKKSIAEKEYEKQKEAFHQAEYARSIKSLHELKAGLDESIATAQMTTDKYLTQQ